MTTATERRDLEREVAFALGYRDFITHGRNGTMAKHPNNANGYGRHVTIPRSYQGPRQITELWVDASEGRSIELTYEAGNWTATLTDPKGKGGQLWTTEATAGNPFEAVAQAILDFADET